MIDFTMASSLTSEELDRHERFMRECILLARQAGEKGESPVGSVLVKDDRIIASGIEAVRQNNDFTFHAEIECIRQGSRVLNTRVLAGCSLYTTHEPCIMCSYMIRQSGIGMVVLGCFSGEKGGLRSGYPLLGDQTILSWREAPRVIAGVLEKDCLELK